jgi:transaldolase
MSIDLADGAVIGIPCTDRHGMRATQRPIRKRSITMKFFVDTADVSEIRAMAQTGLLDGVTTNPSLMAKEGITGKNNILKHYVDICNSVDGDVSAEVNAVDYNGMIREGEELVDLHPQIVVKLPMTKEGVMACKYFSDKGIKTTAAGCK